MKPSAWGMAAALVLAGGPAAAQQAEPADPRPAYQVLRFEEDWSDIRDAGSTDVFDPIKHVRLADGSGSYLSIGGQVRYRAEAARHFLFTDGADGDDLFGLLRVLVHTDVHLGDAVRVFVQGKHAVALGRELPGGRRPLDHDELDLQNAFVELGCCGAGEARLTARIGRQELLVGRQRLVSPLDWANTRRTFDGVLVRARPGGATLNAFWTRPVAVRLAELNRADPETQFFGLTAEASPSPSPWTWTAYILGLHQGAEARFADLEGSHVRYTLGGRVVRRFAGRAVVLEVEGGVQLGELAGERVRAGFVASDLTRHFTEAPLRPALSLGLDWASGDDAPGDGVAGTFHQLYPLAHAYVGFTDVLGRQNLTEARARLTLHPLARVRAVVSGHRFFRASLGDGVYNAGGARTQAAGGSTERAVGSEIDVTAGVQVSRHARLDAGYGWFQPGAFLQGAGASEARSWGFLSAAYTF